MNSLDKIAKEHSTWVRMVRNFGCNESVVEDIVQEMYIKVDSLIKKGTKITYGDNEVNKFYIYLTLKSVYTDYLRSKKSSIFYDVGDSINIMEDNLTACDDDYPIERDEELKKLWSNIIEEMNNWDSSLSYPYNKAIMLAYATTDTSLRKLSKDTGISFMSIVTTVSNGRKKLKDKFTKDVKDYFKKFKHI
jgi:RNA polymerase sigma factor (sigma-70 family)